MREVQQQADDDRKTHVHQLGEKEARLIEVKSDVEALLREKVVLEVAKTELSLLSPVKCVLHLY